MKLYCTFTLQIFYSDIYGFKTEKDSPAILDCGAHVGLVSTNTAKGTPVTWDLVEGI